MSISMPLISTLRALRGALCTTALLAAAGMGTAQGASMVISAEFRPSALDPGRNTFTNTTPRGQYCLWKPEHCSRLNSYVVDLPINIVAKTYVRGPDARKRFYVGLPGPRRVLATNEAGTSIEVNVVISSLSGQLSPGNRSNPVFTQYPSGGCSYVYTAGGSAWTRFGWNVRTPESPTPCHSVGQEGGDGFTGVYASQVLGFGLTVTTDSPLGMQNGLYRGSLQFTVGGLGADIDFGDDVQMTDDMLVMEFEFRVVHDFKVERAPGTETIVLQPENGWRDWIEQGRVPRSIRQELPFLMTSSGDFNVRIECEMQVGERCAIRSDGGDSAAMDVAMTVPGLYNAATGAPAVNHPLVAGGVPPDFQVREYMQSRPSRLAFSVSGEPLQQMLEKPGSRWRGDVTVIFDASP